MKNLRPAHKGYPGKVIKGKRPHIFENHRCVYCGIEMALQQNYGEDCLFRIFEYESLIPEEPIL